MALKNLNVKISSEVIQAMRDRAELEGVKPPEFVSLCIQIAMGRIAGGCKKCGALVYEPITGGIPKCRCGGL